jgi:hypothetical protein
MQIKIILLFFCFSLFGCEGNPSQNNAAQNSPQNSNQSTAGGVNAPGSSPLQANKTDNKITAENGGGPRTVRDYFNLLPQKYFTLEGCEPQKDKNCERARADLIKNYLEVEDTPNGYLKLSCDGGQSCLRMALFKRPDGSYLVGVHTLHEADEVNHFLEYRDGSWTDVSQQVVPGFDNARIYELPRYGTTVQVYKKEFPEKTFSERGAKIYDLEWKDGKFTKK